MLASQELDPLADTESTLAAPLRLVSPTSEQIWPKLPAGMVLDHHLSRLLREYESKRKPRILIVEGEPDCVMQINAALNGDYSLHYASTIKHALSTIKTIQPNLILVDCDLPDDGGFSLCEQLKQKPRTAAIPVILMASKDQDMAEAKAFACGAVDFIGKPLVPMAVRARINNHLSLTHVRQIKASRLLIIRKLSRAAEFRDDETGSHFERMSAYSRVLALGLGLPEAAADDLANAAPMHDIGKIGIPDAILRKNGKLTDEEYMVMKQHPAIGASILHDDAEEDGILAMAYKIALTHHEKWDGSGYPNCLVGDEIPLEGRIVALADVFDALTSARPYKAAWTIEQAVDHITGLAGTHFDPHLIEAFQASVPKFREIQLIA